MLQTSIVLQTSQVIVQTTTAQVMAQVLIDEIIWISQTTSVIETIGIAITQVILIRIVQWQIVSCMPSLAVV
jgi:hypothetical protein